jgi:hypothetical protein
MTSRVKEQLANCLTGALLIFDDASLFCLHRVGASEWLIEFVKAAIHIRSVSQLTPAAVDAFKSIDAVAITVFVMTFDVDEALTAINEKLVGVAPVCNVVGKSFTPLSSSMTVRKIPLSLGCYPLGVGLDDIFLIATTRASPSSNNEHLKELAERVNEHVEMQDLNAVAFGVGAAGRIAALALAQLRASTPAASKTRRNTAAVIFVDRKLDLASLAATIGSENLLDNLLFANAAAGDDATTCTVHTALTRMASPVITAAEPDTDDDTLRCSLLTHAPAVWLRALFGDGDADAREYAQFVLMEFIGRLKKKSEMSAVMGALNAAKLKKIRQVKNLLLCVCVCVFFVAYVCLQAIADDEATRLTRASREADMIACALQVSVIL